MPVDPKGHHKTTKPAAHVLKMITHSRMCAPRLAGENDASQKLWVLASAYSDCSSMRHSGAASTPRGRCHHLRCKVSMKGWRQRWRGKGVCGNGKWKGTA